jgi:hypothetical protein
MPQDKGRTNNQGNQVSDKGLSFYNDPYVEYTVKKTEKIIKATYLLTNFLDVREPLKWALREMSLKLLQKISSTAHIRLPDREKTVLEIISTAKEFGLLVETAEAAGFMSDMNAQVLRGELQLLASFVEERYQDRFTMTSLLQLREEFFHVEQPASDSVLYNNMSFTKPIDKRTNTVVQNLTNKFSPKPITHPISQVAKGQVPTDRSQRQQIIIETAKSIGSFSIKDISHKIQNCSEKTIQRELLDMVKDGILTKEGERRWSKYALKVTA